MTINDDTIATSRRDPDAVMRELEDFWAKNWWALALRGVFGILFGIAAFIIPGVTLLTLVILFAAYMLADGVLAMVAGFRAARRHERSWPMFLEGVADLIAGGIAVTLPGVAAFALVYLFGFWAIVSGVLLTAAGLRRRDGRREALLVLNGVVSAIWGVLVIAWLIFQPAISMLAVVWWVGLYSLTFGVIMLIAAFKLRRRREEIGHAVPHAT
jgi:uncharacterized membrane protein HdeD (DUF308 family)